MAVDPGQRGRGTARALMRDCASRARAAGARELVLQTGGFMTAAIGLYESLGFRRDPDFDGSASRHYGVPGAEEVRLVAYRQHLGGDLG